MNSKKARYQRLVSLVLLLLPLILGAQEKISVKLATGGFSGAFQIGAGYHPTKSWIPDLDLSYGYSRVYDSDVHSVLLGTQWNWTIPNYDKWKLGAGASLVWYHAPNVFTLLPEAYPEGYYKPTSFQGMIEAGIARSVSFAIANTEQHFDIGLKSHLLMGQTWYALINNSPSLPEIAALSVNLRYYVPKINLQSP